MKFRIRSVNVSCSTTSSRKGRLNIVDIELRSASSPVASPASALTTTRTSTAASVATAALATVRAESRSSRNMNSENITRKWNRSARCPPSAPRFSRSWSWLRVAASNSSATSSSAPKRSECRVTRFEINWNSLMTPISTSAITVRNISMLSACCRVSWRPGCTAAASWPCSWTPSPAMNRSSGTTASVPSRKVTTTSCRDSGLRETKNHPHTSEGIMATPAACRNVIAVTSRDTPLTTIDSYAANADGKGFQAPARANLSVADV